MMLVFLFAFLGVLLYRISFNKDSFYTDYLSKDKTNAIKGIFILVVFINHISEYYKGAGTDLSHWYDAALFLVPKAFGQLMVVMFLFYSGYGVTESIKAKGRTYINSIPRKRVLNTLLNFDVAVVIFALACLALGIQISWKEFSLSLTGWNSVGNSNWYIFSIIVCYSLSYFAFGKFQQGGVVLCCLIAIFAVIMSFWKGTWWYNTLFAYGTGVIFSQYKKEIVGYWEEHYFKSIVITISAFLLFLSIYLTWYGPFKGVYERYGAFIFNMMSVFFALLVVLISMKVSFNNGILRWLGTNLFPLYIFQRLPMMVIATLYSKEIVVGHPCLFFLGCLCFSLCFAYLYRFIKISI